MIYHVFQLNSKAYSLNLGIISSFMRLSKKSNIESIKPIFILIEYHTEYTSKFIQLFNSYNWTDYLIINEKNFSHSLKECKDKPIVLHGPTYKLIGLSILNKFKNINWICWGKGSRINWKNWKSIFFSPIKYFMYHQFNTIITLLDGDKETLKSHYRLKNVRTIPYFSEKDKNLIDYIKVLKETFKETNKPIILLGNSGHCIDYYITYVEKLRNFQGRIQVHCMLSYGADRYPEKVDILQKKGKEIFGADFVLDYTYYNYSEYLKYMNKASVYIGGNDKQSGLGAIYTMLTLGKKVFINGVNYEHIKSLNIYVNHIDSLESDLLIPLSEKEKEINYVLVDSLSAKSEIMWINYLKSIIK